MRVLYVCAELFPFLKTGGLADVSAGLPPALQALGCDVRLLMPGFPVLAQAATARRHVAPLPTGPAPWGRAPTLPAAALDLLTVAGLELPLYLLNAPDLFDRPGNPYLGPDGTDWPDNAQRFAALGWTAALLGQGLDPDWVPDVIHCHDWHAGLAPVYGQAFASAHRDTPVTVFTVHNLAYQGLFPASALAPLGLPALNLESSGLEFFGKLSFMKGAIQFADRVTTVSPTYAHEITTEPQGCGLDGLLRERADYLSGVLNGVDYDIWSPATDPWLSSPYDVDTLPVKALAKQALQQHFGLAQRPEALVFGVVSRLSEQKGLHLLPQVLDDLVRRGGQLALLGQGDPALERAFADAANYYPGQVAVRIGYGEATAHTVVAGADVIVVPSAFEPCGLTQLYGLRYGTLPLVRRVGGLADTVVDCTLENLDEDVATGFTFEDLSASGLLSAVKRAFVLFRQPSTWARVQQRGMGLRFDWRTAAQHYQAMYLELRPGAK